MKLRSVAHGIATAMMVTVLAACGGGSQQTELAGDWDGIVAAAKDEGSLTLYTSAGTAPSEALVRGFENKYGIDVTLVRGIDSELLPKVETELGINRGIADVFITSDQTWVESHPEAVMNIEGPSVHDVAYAASENAPDGTWAATHAFVAALSWNTDLVDTAPTSAADLLSPELAGGRIGLPNPDTSPSIVQFYANMEKAQGPDFLERLAAQKPRIYSSTATVMQAIASGEIAISPYTQPMVDEKAAGAPVDYVIPEDAWGASSFGGVLTTAPNPNAGQLFLDYLLSREGQSAFTAPKYATPRTDVDGAAAAFEEITLTDGYPEQDKVADFRARFKSLMF